MSSPSSPHSLATLRERHGESYRWRVLLTVMIGTMASIMASTIVNVAVPDMSRRFTLGQERAQWLSAGFMAAMTVSMLTTSWLLAISPELPARSVPELVAYAKANPGKISFGFAQGTASQLVGDRFKVLTGTDIVNVPYKGAGGGAEHRRRARRGVRLALDLFRRRAVLRRRARARAPLSAAQRARWC